MANGVGMDHGTDLQQKSPSSPTQQQSVKCETLHQKYFETVAYAAAAAAPKPGSPGKVQDVNQSAPPVPSTPPATSPPTSAELTAPADPPERNKPSIPHTAHQSCDRESVPSTSVVDLKDKKSNSTTSKKLPRTSKTSRQRPVRKPLETTFPVEPLIVVDTSRKPASNPSIPAPHLERIKKKGIKTTPQIKTTLRTTAGKPKSPLVARVARPAIAIKTTVGVDKKLACITEKPKPTREKTKEACEKTKVSNVKPKVSSVKSKVSNSQTANEKSKTGIKLKEACGKSNVTCNKPIKDSDTPELPFEKLKVQCEEPEESVEETVAASEKPTDSSEKEEEAGIKVEDDCLIESVTCSLIREIIVEKKEDNPEVVLEGETKVEEVRDEKCRDHDCESSVISENVVGPDLKEYIGFCYIIDKSNLDENDSVRVNCDTDSINTLTDPIDEDFCTQYSEADSDDHFCDSKETAESDSKEIGDNSLISNDSADIKTDSALDIDEDFEDLSEDLGSDKTADIESEKLDFKEPKAETRESRLNRIKVKSASLTRKSHDDPGFPSDQGRTGLKESGSRLSILRNWNDNLRSLYNRNRSFDSENSSYASFYSIDNGNTDTPLGSKSRRLKWTPKILSESRFSSTNSGTFSDCASFYTADTFGTFYSARSFQLDSCDNFQTCEDFQKYDLTPQSKLSKAKEALQRGKDFVKSKFENYRKRLPALRKSDQGEESGEARFKSLCHRSCGFSCVHLGKEISTYSLPDYSAGKGDNQGVVEGGEVIELSCDKPPEVKDDAGACSVVQADSAVIEEMDNKRTTGNPAGGGEPEKTNGSSCSSNSDSGDPGNGNPGNGNPGNSKPGNSNGHSNSSAANHCIPIWTVREFDNAIANRIIDRYKNDGYVYIPSSLETGVFTHFSCDNIDVLECTLDGKNTFHSTQMMAWQRSTDIGLHSEEIGGPDNTKVIDKEIMKVYQTIDDSKMTKGKRKSPPHEAHGIGEDVMTWLNDDTEQRTDISNLVWTFARGSKDSDTQKYPLWGAFQESVSTEQHDLTNACMLPILSAPADEYDTIATVIAKFQAISQKIGQAHTVITADQPLYTKGQELVWANRQGKEGVIFMMGGLHICFNFLRAIGQHMECSGSEDILLEAGVFGPNAAAAALEGKHYYRAVRGHQLTYEALWRLKWQHFEQWLLATYREFPSLDHELAALASAFSQSYRDRVTIQESIEHLENALKKEHILSLLTDFDNEMKGVKNYAFWHSYMRMVEILLGFIKAQRTGNWPLHVQTFAAMLPWLTVYDHTNYARWGPIYLSDMKNLENTAPAVYKEFMAGNFVVKMSKHYFNEVPADQATEWINKMCKATGGIIGITRKDTARDRFCITWSIRSQVSRDTGILFEQFSDEEETELHRKDSTPARIKAEEGRVKKLVQLLETQDVFRLPSEDQSMNVVDDKLVAILSKDVASDDICHDLLSCESRGKVLVERFFRTRLDEKSIDFYAPLPKVKSKTFAHMYKVTSGTQQRTLKILKADRKLLQRLFNAASSGRDVQTAEVLEHELSPVPLSLADASGQMNSTSKAQILNVLTTDRGIDTPSRVPASDIPTCVIIDGHALVQAIGKPQGCDTFGDYADTYVQAVYRHFAFTVTRVDVAFDRYLGGQSIKVTTRTKRTGKRRPISKLVTNRDVPLPQVWDQYIAQEDNKSDLAEFLSNELMVNSDNLPNGSTIVVGGGYRGEMNARSSTFNADHLSANHEEADTRMIVHAKDAIERGYMRLEIISRDTDVLLLLVYHLGEEAECWMVSDTGRSRRCYPIHSISRTLNQDVRKSIPCVNGL